MTQIVASPLNHDIATAICHELIRLARQEEDTAAAEASSTPYWEPCPPSVSGHRQAARALRADAARLESRARPQIAGSYPTRDVADMPL